MNAPKKHGAPPLHPSFINPHVVTPPVSPMSPVRKLVLKLRASLKTPFSRG